MEITDYIRQSAEKWKIDPGIALDIAKCESGYDLKIQGDHGSSIGLWQIHLPAHPTISVRQAESLSWSTEWAMSQMSQGKYKMWSCYNG